MSVFANLKESKQISKISFSLMIVLLALAAACGGGNSILPGGKKSPFSSAKVGDTIQFGWYDWRVLDIQDGKALILSDNVLTRRAYSSRVATWEDSDLRQYLNGSFYDNTFTAEEKEWIAESRIVNNANPWYGTSGGIATIDNVFLLSIEEVFKYFPSSNVSVISDDISDEYNSARIAVDKDTGTASWWWLRSPGYGSRSAASVNDDGLGYIVDVNYGGVRPALWLNL